MSNKCILYRSYKDGILECTACNHYCKIPKNQTGICGIRQNIDGKLVLLTYGKALGVNIDPIEKKPLYHFLPGTQIFSLGTAGCNFRCEFCQNRTMSQAKSFPKIINQGTDLSPKEIVQQCIENNIPSIAYTYSEPTVFFEYAYDTMKLAHKHGIKNVRVSNGFMSIECLNKLEKYLDAINVDLKSFNPKFYQKTCGGRLQPVLDNIKQLHDHKIWQEITTLIIPGKNDSEKEITDIAKFIYSVSPDIPWHLSAFHGMYKMQNVPATKIEILTKAYEIGKKIGLKYIYIGNIPHNGYENTKCPNCNYELISRTGYNINIKFKDGICPQCKTNIPGRRK